MNIYKPDETFDFNMISLASPQPAQAGSFFTKLTIDSGKLLYIQLPKCITKQNIVEAMQGKYCDLMYERDDEDKLMNWIEQFENTCQNKIDEKKSLWFQTELSKDDIQTMMSPITRLYKSGKNILIRAHLNTTSKQKCIAYDENENLLHLDSINADKYIIPLILIEGIKFSSRSFEIEIKLVQIMVIDPPTIKETPLICLIKNSKSQFVNVSDTVNASDKINASENETINLNKVNDLEKDSIDKILPEIQEHRVEDLEKIKKSNVTISNSTFDGVEEISLDFNDIKESISLKKPNDVYYEIYKAAREKAKHMRKVAIEAYLEAKEIKTKYMLTDMDDSDESDYEEETN